MSKSHKTRLPLDNFFILVREVTSREKLSVKVIGLIGHDPLCIPNLESGKTNQISFYMPIEQADELAQPGNLLFAKQAAIHLMDSSYGIVVTTSLLVGTMSLDKPKKKWTREILPFEAESISNYRIPVWQIPPRS